MIQLTLALAPGTRLGVCEITALLGEGGMGQVYRATDTRLKREVAIKVLPPSLNADPDRLARFQREAEVLASLNHPGIAAIYGFEDGGDDGVSALVMELVEGPTLADRIAQGRMPLAEALPIARQVAEALEAAHALGIIHRDLKPANIKVRADGVAKVLDFGLAKALEPAGAGEGGGAGGALGLSQSPTITTPAMTRAGMILGTAAYMSPEQAKGRVVDKRADVWAFGCVVYEMVTGARAFKGEDVSDTLAEVLKSDPTWTALPIDTPPAIRRLLRRALTKDAKNRLPDITSARLDIDDALSGAHSGSSEDLAGAAGAAPTNHASSRVRERLAWGIAGVLLLSTLALGIAWSRSRTSPASTSAREMRVEISTPPAALFSFALSPDGTRLAFVSEGRVWVRPLESQSPQPLAGTEGATGLLFWSPDGASIGFAATRQLKRVDVRSGLARSLAAVTNIIGGTSAPNGNILFVPSPASPVLRISAGGGEGVAVTKLAAGQVGHRFPQFLPDGRHFVFLAVGTKETRGIYVGSLDSPDTRRLFESDSRAMFSPPDALLYMRQGALEARRLNLQTLSLEGDARPVASRVFVATGSFNNVAMSGASALLAYRSHGGVQRLMWVDRSGRRLSQLGEPHAAMTGNLEGSRAGSLVAMPRTVDGNSDIWILDTERGVQRRLTFGDERDDAPVWSPDGRRIAFSSERTGVFDLFERPADGSGRETALVSSPEPKLVEDWSRDGRNLLFTVQSREGARDLWVLPFDGDRKPLQLTRTPFDETAGRFSPDGRWIAYHSNETGRFEVYVESFPDLKGRVQVSPQGEGIPFWRRDGRELLYQALDRRIMAVPIDISAESVRPGTPVALFQSSGEWWPSPDGQRFLVAEETEPPAPITLILNWAGLPR